MQGSRGSSRPIGNRRLHCKVSGSDDRFGVISRSTPSHTRTPPDWVALWSATQRPPSSRRRLGCNGISISKLLAASTDPGDRPRPNALPKPLSCGSSRSRWWSRPRGDTTPRLQLNRPRCVCGHEVIRVTDGRAAPPPPSPALPPPPRRPLRPAPTVAWWLSRCARVCTGGGEEACADVCDDRH